MDPSEGYTDEYLSLTYNILNDAIGILKANSASDFASFDPEKLMDNAFKDQDNPFDDDYVDLVKGKSYGRIAALLTYKIFGKSPDAKFKIPALLLYTGWDDSALNGNLQKYQDLATNRDKYNLAVTSTVNAWVSAFAFYSTPITFETYKGRVKAGVYARDNNSKLYLDTAF